jgi:NADP-dependent 3-hydroxy acid dehydrogenase YdfG
MSRNENRDDNGFTNYLTNLTDSRFEFDEAYVSLKGKNALVTGASSGIGRAVAQALAREGAQVTLVGRDGARLREVLNGAAYHSADLTEDADLQRVVKSIDQIDILVHSAGLYAVGAVRDTSVATLDMLYRLNVRVPYLMTQALLPQLIEAKGQIVFVNSSAQPQANLSQYTATKHALKALADSVRAEVNAAGVRVLSVYPGRTATAMQQSIYTREGRTYQPDMLLQPEDVANAILHALQMPRTAEITDLHLRPLQKS